MTKLREPLTYQYTLEQVARAIGWERAGAICGVTARTIRYWSDHDCETEIRMIDAERLDHAFMDAGGDCAPFHRLLALRLDMAARNVTAQDIARHAAAAAKETGEAVSAIVNLIGSPSDPAARRGARREIEEAIDTLTDCAAALDDGGASR